MAHWGLNDEYSAAGGDSGSKEPKDDDVIDDSDVEDWFVAPTFMQ